MNIPPDISSEIIFRTARSGGKGGQNVNKVETMVMGYFDVGNSLLLSAEQKQTVQAKLSNKINAEGLLYLKSQVHRSQLSNKEEVTKKMNLLISQALKKTKKRLSTQPSKASKIKRLESKKKQSEHKQNRQRIRQNDL